MKFCNQGISKTKKSRYMPLTLSQRLGKPLAEPWWQRMKSLGQGRFQSRDC